MKHSFLISHYIFVILLVQVTIDASDCKNAIPGDSSWKKGIALLDSGQLSNGLRFADSISNNFEPTSDRMVTYARKIIQLFIFTNQVSDSVILLKNRSTLNDTLNLSTFNYRMNNSSGKTKELPNFVFNFIFPIEKPYHLIFNGLTNATPPSLKMYGREIYSSLNDDLVNQSMFKNDSISCTIFIDFSKQMISLYDYVGEFARGVYDSISFKPDLKRYHALSLRGYSRPWSIEDGRFTAIIAFDRLFDDRKSTKGRIKPLPARYTIMVKSNISTSEFAEVKLQKILKML
jgi:hypothetical protein